jgi:triacylglycerol lipase
MHILLVHGIFDTGNIFKRLIQTLEASGHRCYAPDLKPADARLGLVDLAEKLKVLVEKKWGCAQPMAVIGFSMGCLVARYYLQELGGYQRTLALFCLSGPHYGTLTAFGYFGSGARDMRPNSRFLTRLREHEQRLSSISINCYRTPFDLMILPSTSSDWHLAKNTTVYAPAHHLMLSHHSLIADIVDKLQSGAE